MPVNLDELDLAVVIVNKIIAEIKPAVVVGYSQGAIVSLFAQMQYPEVFKNVVAVCPGMIVGREFRHIDHCNTSIIAHTDDRFTSQALTNQLAVSLRSEIRWVNGDHTWSPETVAAIREIVS